MWAILAVLMAQAINTDSVAPIRPVLSAYTAEVGISNVVDTYLSPLKYKGWQASFNYERMQAMKFNPEKWVMRLAVGVDVDRNINQAGNALMWNAGLDLSWGMMYRWQLPVRITLAAGGSTGLNLGCLYSARNGNNPASAKATWTVNMTGIVAWNIKIGSLPITLRYQPTLPLTGVFFAPDYGQLYYEIYLGNTSNLVHMAWWGSYFAMENLLSIDLHLSSNCLRIGYRNNILSTQINDVISRMSTHSIALGLAGEWVSLSSRRKVDTQSSIISALY